MNIYIFICLHLFSIYIWYPLFVICCGTSLDDFSVTCAHHNQDGLSLCGQALPPPPAPGNRWCLLPSTSFALSEMHHNWSHEVGGTWGLAFLTRRHDLAAHPRLCVYQVCSCILLDHLWRVVHGTEGPPCVHPSTSWRIFEGF